MNGAESLVRSLVAKGVRVCFANPGTSEMHFVAALDKVAGLRCILGLHETIVTGAADGYARMAGFPAVTLLHTGPGLANGLSNLHNARKAKTPVVNVVGEHALTHIEHDAPLTSDIQSIAATMSHWVSTPKNANLLASAGATAVDEACCFPGNVATLILPANTAWEQVDEVRAVSDSDVSGSKNTGALVPKARIDEIAAQITQAKLKNEPICIILGGDCLTADALEWADKLAQYSDITVFAETFNARLQRGAGRVAVQEVPYAIDSAIDALSRFKHVVTVAAKAPVGFFAYPDKPSTLYPEDARVQAIAQMHEDGVQALIDLAITLGVDKKAPRVQVLEKHAEPENGPLTVTSLGVVLANLLPEQAIVVDEAITSGPPLFNLTRCSPAHDWLEVCGGSIGGGMPLAVGAAVACPDRKVINLQADGSGMYSLQALWTQAREKLDVLTIIFSNSSYAILKHELDNVQAKSGRVALDMMELERPKLDWVSLAEGMGVQACRVETVEQFKSAMSEALRTHQPYLIEAIVP